jgi:hypothetical protein
VEVTSTTEGEVAPPCGEDLLPVFRAAVGGGAAEEEEEGEE